VVAEDKQDLAFVLGLLDSHVQRLVVQHLLIMAKKSPQRMERIMMEN
jgi:hypothetical protein